MRGDVLYFKDLGRLFILLVLAFFTAKRPRTSNFFLFPYWVAGSNKSAKIFSFLS